MPRYALKIEYDGRPFAGWQWQATRSRACRARSRRRWRAIAPEGRRVAGAGRTDAGVHALGQVAHVDLARDWEPDAAARGAERASAARRRWR